MSCALMPYHVFCVFFTVRSKENAFHMDESTSFAASSSRVNRAGGDGGREASFSSPRNPPNALLQSSIMSSSHASQSSSPTSKRRSSAYTSEALFEHLEEERTQGVANSPVKRKNPRVPDPEPKLVPPSTLPLVLAPMSPTASLHRRSPSPLIAADAALVPSTIFVANGEASGMYLSVPSTAAVARASLLFLGRHHPPTTSGNAQQDTLLSWLRDNDGSAFTDWMNLLGGLSACCGEKPTDSNNAQHPAQVHHGRDYQFVDLRWLPHVSEMLQALSLMEDSTKGGNAFKQQRQPAPIGLEQEAAKRFPAPVHHFTHAVPQSALFSMPFEDDWQQVTLSALEGGEMLVAVTLTASSTAASVDASAAAAASPITRILSEWCRSVVSSCGVGANGPSTPSSLPTVSMGLRCALHDCLLRYVSALEDADDTMVVIVLLPLLLSPTHNSTSLGRPVSLSALLPLGIEGYALVGDGRRAAYVVGGMQSAEVLECSQAMMPSHSRTFLHPHPQLAMSMTPLATGPFSFLRESVKLQLTSLASPSPLHVQGIKVTGTKSLTVPGLAYHTVVMKNPPEGLRDAPSVALAFGGFLNCVEKTRGTTEAAPAVTLHHGGSAVSLRRQHHNQGASSRSFRQHPPTTARYGWVDCAVEAAPFNTTADSPVQIPGAFNGDLVQHAARARDPNRSRKDVVSATGNTSSRLLPSWEAAHAESTVPTLTCTNAVWSLDVVSGLWKHVVTAGAVPSPRVHHTAAVCGSWMVVVGGTSADGAPVLDVVALHTDQHMWVRLIVETPAPLGISPLCLTTPQELLMAPRPFLGDAAEPPKAATMTNGEVNSSTLWDVTFVSCDMRKLLRNAEARKRIEVISLKHDKDGASEGGDASSFVVLRSQVELDAILARLTAADEASAQALEALREKHQEAADRTSGASSHLRTIKRPKSTLDAATGRLFEQDRPQRRLESALDWVHKRYEAPLAERRRKLTDKQVQESVARMSDLTVDQWAKARAARLKALERKQLEGRLPPTAIEMRKHDASYQPPAVSSDDICSRLAPKDYWTQKESKQATMIDAVAKQSRAQHNAAPGNARRQKANGGERRTASEVTQHLFDNTAQTEGRAKLYEQYVVAPSPK